MLKSTRITLSFVFTLVVAVMLSATQTVWGVAVTWNVAGSGDWDTTTANWMGGSTMYTDSDDVTFDNTAGGAINLTANRAPGSTTVSAVSGTYTFNTGSITSGNLTKSGAGTLVLNNSFTTTNGTISIGAGGIIQLGNSERIADSVSINGSGTLDMNNFNETVKNIASGTNYINMGDLTVKAGFDKGSGTMSGNGRLIVDTSTNFGLILGGGGKTWTGGTVINSGKLMLYGSSGQLPSTGTLDVNAPGRFDLIYAGHAGTLGQTKTIGALNGDGEVRSDGSGNANDVTFRVGNGGGSGTYGGVFSGGGSLVKLGAGTQTMNGNNTYIGTTSVEGGSLLVNGITGPGQDDYTVKTGGTLGGTGTINLAATKDVIVEAGGTVAPGTSPGTLTINGDLTLLDGSFLEIELGPISDLLVVNGELTGATSVGGVTIDVTNVGGGVGPIAFLDWSGGTATGVELSDFQLLDPSAGDLSISGSQLLFAAAVPEPSSLLCLAALMGLCAMRRRRRKV